MMEKTDNKEQFKKNMTAEEKKAQREAVNAEKLAKKQAAKEKREKLEKEKAEKEGSEENKKDNTQKSKSKKSQFTQPSQQSKITQEGTIQANTEETKQETTNPTATQASTSHIPHKQSNKSQNERKAKEIKNAPVSPPAPPVINNVSINRKEVILFSHLTQYNDRRATISYQRVDEDIHPAIVECGMKIASGLIKGVNSRCTAILMAFRKFIEEYRPSEIKALNRDLKSKIDAMEKFLEECRPFSAAIENAVKYINKHIMHIPPTANEDEARRWLIMKLDEFIEQKIIYPNKIMIKTGLDLIDDGEVILTYGRSKVVEDLFKKAHQKGKKFRVIIADSRPELEGRNLLSRLSARGIKCTYTLLQGVLYLMKDVTKVVLGASAMLSNGALISRVGTAMVACMAYNYKVPVIVFSESYKFTEKVLLDSICYNELANPDIVSYPTMFAHRYETLKSELKEWKTMPNITLLNLKYDVTPSTYISMIVTELGLLPPTSVPVVLREFTTDDQIVYEPQYIA